MADRNALDLFAHLRVAPKTQPRVEKPADDDTTDEAPKLRLPNWVMDLPKGTSHVSVMVVSSLKQEAAEGEALKCYHLYGNHYSLTDGVIDCKADQKGVVRPVVAKEDATADFTIDQASVMVKNINSRCTLLGFTVYSGQKSPMFQSGKDDVTIITSDAITCIHLGQEYYPSMAASRRTPKSAEENPVLKFLA